MEPNLSSLALNNWLLSTVLTAVWILVCNSLIHNNKSTHKISFIFVKTLQALFRDFHASAFLICREHVRHPSCAKLFHIQFFMQNISYTIFSNAYSLSSFTLFHPPVIQYHIVHLFNDLWCCCTFWTSFTWIIIKAGRPRLNSAAHIVIVENEGEDFP
jgi:hypothetical protein